MASRHRRRSLPEDLEEDLEEEALDEDLDEDLEEEALDEDLDEDLEEEALDEVRLDLTETLDLDADFLEAGFFDGDFFLEACFLAGDFFLAACFLAGDFFLAPAPWPATSSWRPALGRRSLLGRRLLLGGLLLGRRSLLGGAAAALFFRHLPVVRLRPFLQPGIVLHIPDSSLERRRPGPHGLRAGEAAPWQARPSWRPASWPAKPSCRGWAALSLQALASGAATSLRCSQGWFCTYRTPSSDGDQGHTACWAGGRQAFLAGGLLTGRRRA